MCFFNETRKFFKGQERLADTKPKRRQEASSQRGWTYRATAKETRHARSRLASFRVW